MSSVTRLARAFLEAHPDDAARVLEALPPAEAIGPLTACPPDVAADVLRHMVPPQAGECLPMMAPEHAGAIVAAMPAGRAADILRRIPQERCDVLLAATPAEAAAAILRLLHFPKGTAGSLMDPLAFALPDDITVAAARRRLQKASHRIQYYIYVVDRARRLVGVLNLREFMLASPKERISAIMRREVVWLSASAGPADLVRSPHWRKYQSLPVVDDGGLFVGVLGYDALRRLEQFLDYQRAERTLLDALLAFGELYWAGLAGLLGGPRQGVANPNRTAGGSDERE